MQEGGGKLNNQNIIVQAELMNGYLQCECIGAPEESEYAFNICKNDEVINKSAYQPDACFSYPLDEQGEYYVKVFVKCAEEECSFESLPVSFIPENALLELTDRNRMCCEYGGADNEHEYAFYVLKDGEEIDRIPYQKSGRYVYWPMEAGRYTMKVFIRNAAGKRSVYSNEVIFDGIDRQKATETPKARRFSCKDIVRNICGVIKEILTHRERMIRISLYDYQVLNKDAYLGNAWNVLNPLIQIATYWFVFGFGIRGGQDVDGFPYLVWMLCGMIPWFYFSAGITGGAGAIRQKGISVLKMRYPMAIIPYEKILVEFYNHVTMIGILLITLILMGYMPTIYWLNLIYYLVYGIVFLASLAMVTSVLSMIALDTQKLIQASIRLLFYLTPILWSLDRMPPQIGKILRLNPVLYYVDGFRESLLYQVAFYHNPKKVLFFWLINVVLFAIGCNLIMKYKDQFIDMQ